MKKLPLFLVSIVFVVLYLLAVTPKLFLGPATVSAQQLSPVDYDIVYVRALRHGDSTNTFWPDATTPLMPEAGADLVLLHPDGREDVLFTAGPTGAVLDPSVSYDARSVVFSFFHNAQNTTNSAELTHSTPFRAMAPISIELNSPRELSLV